MLFVVCQVLLELLTGLPPYDETREGYDLVSLISRVSCSIFSVGTGIGHVTRSVLCTELYKMGRIRQQDYSETCYMKRFQNNVSNELTYSGKCQISFANIVIPSVLEYLLEPDLGKRWSYGVFSAMCRSGGALTVPAGPVSDVADRG